MKKKIFTGVTISIISIVLVLILWITNVIEPWEHKFYDYKFIFRGTKKPKSNIVIIGIDEESLARFGRWPWQRSILAKAIRNLKKAGASVIGIDIIFPEKSQDRTQDISLAKAIRYAGCVVGAIHFEYIPQKIAEMENGELKFKEVIKRKLVLPTKELNVFRETGFTNAEPDTDGTLRYAKIYDFYNDEKYFSFNSQIASLFLGKKPEELKLPQILYANFRGESKTYPRYSFSLIYDSNFPKEWIKDKIVLLGSTATGAFDHYPTPFDKMYPGIEFHATVIDNILNRDYIRIVPNFILFLILVLFSLFLGQIYLKVKTSTSIIVFLVSLFGYFLISQYLISVNIHLDFLKPGLGIIFTYLGIMGYRFRTEEREKKWIKKTFSYYLSPQVISELISNPEKLKLGGERKNLTVLFSDIRGFTSLSEKLNPEETVGILNEYLSSMTEIIFKYNGTLDKFIGDAVMAFWGAPIPQEDHAEKAVFCAIEMIEKLAQLQEQWKQQNKPIIDIGIGINTGEMVVGNMGSNQRMDYTVIGDNVNLASRLETLNKQYGTKIIISETTYQIVKDKIEAKLLGQVNVKGRQKPVTIYEVLRRIQ